MIDWVILIIILVALIIFGRVLKRGFFWRSKSSEELSLKQFLSRWKKGVVEITPLQQTVTSLWSMIPIFFGMFWGMVVTFIGGVYWMTLILTFSLPLMFINFISTYQKYMAQKLAYEAYEEAMKPKRRRGRK